MEVPVTLIVKAPNQQFDDQTIKCELSWTIRRLKGYLSEVYPCKPSRDEQKLIYSGQLLHDTVVLKDVLRSYDEQMEDQQIHTVHLVYTPKYKPKPTINITQSSSTSNNKPNITTTSPSTTDGLRQRNITTASSNPTSNISLSPQQPNIINDTGHFNSNNVNISNGISNNFAGGNLFDAQSMFNTNLAAQQLALHNWMQNAYSQYLNQYMTLMQMGVSPESIYASENNAHNLTTPASFYPSTIDPASMINLSQSYPVPAPQIQQSEQPQIQQNNQPPAPQPAGEPNRQVAAVPGQEAQQQNQPQPRFPNIVIDDAPDNNDWLDMFYALSRLAIFLALVYLYSSVVRCCIVLLIAFVLFAYNYYRRNVQDANARPNLPNNNNAAPINNNNNVAVQDNNINNNNAENVVNNTQLSNDEPQAQISSEIVQDQPETTNNTPTVDNENPPSVEETQNETNQVNANATSSDDAEARTVVSFIRTFVVSFFTSLIPEPPAL